MTWQRAPVAAQLASTLTLAAAAQGIECSVFEVPPFTLNASAIVIGRPTEVRYAVASLGIDEIDLPVTCVAGVDQDETAAALVALVRSTVDANQSLDGVVQSVIVAREHNWRHVNVSGADLLTVEVALSVLM